MVEARDILPCAGLVFWLQLGEAVCAIVDAVNPGGTFGADNGSAFHADANAVPVRVMTTASRGEGVGAHPTSFLPRKRHRCRLFHGERQIIGAWRNPQKGIDDYIYPLHRQVVIGIGHTLEYTCRMGIVSCLASDLRGA